MVRQTSALLLALVVMVVAWVGWAQDPGLEAPDQEASEVSGEQVAPVARPAASGTTCPGTAVVALADFISAYLGESGRLPDLVQAQTTGRGLRTLSAAEAFSLVARTVDLWRTSGELPESVPITPTGVRAPEIDPEDVPQREVDTSVGREIPTGPFLDQCQATVRWLDRLRQVPTAVWVDGERLSAAEYMAGLVICLQYAYYQGQLLDTIFLPAYAPPHTWLAGAAPTAASASGEQEESAQEGSSGETEGVGPEAVPLASAVLEPVTPVEAAAGPAAALERPRLTLFPEAGTKLQGRVDIVANYAGPPAKFVTFAVDEMTRAIMNIPPYGFRWDTSTTPPGVHMVRVQVIGEGEVTLVDQVHSYTVVAGEARAAPEQPEEEF
jgi:hypothetical protein